MVVGPLRQEPFASIDPELWHRIGRDPVALLGEGNPGRLDELAADNGFLNASTGCRPI